MKYCLIDGKPIKIFHANKLKSKEYGTRYICKYHFQDLNMSYKAFLSKEIQGASREFLIMWINENMPHTR